MVPHPYLTRSLTRFFFLRFCGGPAEPVDFLGVLHFKDVMVSHPYLTRSLTRFFFTVLWWTRRTRIFFGVQHFFKGRYGIAPLFDPFSHPFFFHGSVLDPPNPYFFWRAALFLRTRRTRIFLACSTFFKDGMVPHPYLTRSLTRWTRFFLRVLAPRRENRVPKSNRKRSKTNSGVTLGITTRCSQLPVYSVYSILPSGF